MKDSKAKEKTTKKGKKIDIVSSALFLIGIGLILFAGIKLYGIFSDYHKSNEVYDGLADEYVTVVDTTEQTTEQTSEEPSEQEVPWYRYVSVNLSGVQETNQDVVGWIWFENEKISYPVLYSGDNTTYLRTSINKMHATAGSIFMEGANTSDFEDSHTIIYGHNMHNLSMFGRLKYYKEKEDYYPEHMYFQIITNDAVYRYQIFAYADVPEDSSIYQVPFSPSDEFQEFINGIYRTSYIDAGVTATKNDKIITLSTCSAKGYRFVVHAVRVDTYVYENNDALSE